MNPERLAALRREAEIPVHDQRHMDSLKGGYGGLYGEVVTYDTYKLRTVEDVVSVNDPSFIHVKGHKGVSFIPDVIFDLGANVGIFSRYARQLWPDALIVSVEPNPGNAAYFQEFTQDENLIFIQKAIGEGKIWHFNGAVNGSGESYMTSGIGIDTSKEQPGNVDVAEIEAVMPDALINQYVKPGQKFLVKMDIEGGESAVFQHEPSMIALRKADYLCAEIHFYCITDSPGSREKILKALDSFNQTHECELDHIHFYATKK